MSFIELAKNSSSNNVKTLISEITKFYQDLPLKVRHAKVGHMTIFFPNHPKFFINTKLAYGQIDKYDEIYGATKKDKEPIYSQKINHKRLSRVDSISKIVLFTKKLEEDDAIRHGKTCSFIRCPDINCIRLFYISFRVPKQFESVHDIIAKINWNLAWRLNI